MANKTVREELRELWLLVRFHALYSKNPTRLQITLRKAIEFFESRK